MQRPDDELEIDIAAGELRTPDGQRHAFALDAFARTCLLEGVDELGYLLARGADIQRYESRFQETSHVV
jgi:3-isopropylmalate/(R)-2-methylmalate dehydratase small subunit